MMHLNELVRAQKERIKQVLVDGLAQDLININDINDILIAPSNDQYWITTGINPLDVIFNSNQAMIISQQTSASYPKRLTGNQAQSSVLTAITYAVSFIFKWPSATEPVTRLGEELRQFELIDLMADRYKGAMLTTLLRDAVDGVSILEIQLKSDWSDAIAYDSIGVIGRALLQFEVKSQALIPTSSYAVARRT